LRKVELCGWVQAVERKRKKVLEKKKRMG